MIASFEYILTDDDLNGFGLNSLIRILVCYRTQKGQSLNCSIKIAQIYYHREGLNLLNKSNYQIEFLIKAYVLQHRNKTKDFKTFMV